MYSVVIPVYKNEEGLLHLFDALRTLQSKIKNDLNANLEVVFVVDGSPDKCAEILAQNLDNFKFQVQLIELSRNFGSFQAIRVGLLNASGSNFAVMAADLQEPIDLVLEFFKILNADRADVVVGKRESRTDPVFSKLTSTLFWKLYRKLVIKEIPEGGVDIFGCNKAFRDQLIAFSESHSSLVGLIYWLGFRRIEVKYNRVARQYGKSAWSFSKKFKYMLDSIFSFTDLPIKFLIMFGLLGISVSILFAAIVLTLKAFSLIAVPGYAATILTMVFFGGLNSLGLGIVGNYTWRTYENSKQRPLAVVRAKKTTTIGN